MPFKRESSGVHPTVIRVRESLSGARVVSENQTESVTRHVRVDELVVGNIILYQGALYRVNVKFDRNTSKLGVRPINGGRDVSTHIFGDFSEIPMASVDTIVTVKG